MKKTRNLREKRVYSNWYIIAGRRITTRIGRDVENLDLDFRTRRAAERCAKLLRRRGWMVFLRHRELVQTYDRFGRKHDQTVHVTAYSRHGKERWF